MYTHSRVIVYPKPQFMPFHPWKFGGRGNLPEIKQSRDDTHSVYRAAGEGVAGVLRQKKKPVYRRRPTPRSVGSGEKV